VGIVIPADPVAFWPWGRRSALAASAVLLVFLVGGVAVLRVTADWPDARWEGAFALAAVLLSLVPIGLLVLATVAESKGSVSFRGLSVDFGAAAQAAAAAVTRSTISIPRNVTQEGVDIGDSGHAEVLSVLAEASRAEVVVVDLEDGHAWWDTRLLLLCAGAQLQGRPRTVVFVATVDTVARCFVGWSYPADIVAQILKASPDLRFAYATARTSVRRAELTFPGNAPSGGYPSVTPALPLAAGTDPMPTSVVSDHELFDRQGDFQLPQQPATAFTRALGRAVRPLEDNGNVAQLSVVRLRDLLTPVLHTSSTDQDASDDEWLRAVVDLDSEYLVVTNDDVYRGLAPRAHLTAALLKALVLSATDTQAPNRHA